MLAELRGWSQFVGLQIRYSLLDRAGERDLLPMARALDIGVTAWGALGAGILTGKYNKNSAEQGRAGMWNSVDARGLAIAEEVTQVAAEIERSPSQVALNWVRQQPGVVIPILGSRKLAQIQDNLACVDFKLTEAQMQRLQDASKIDLGFPHDFLASDEVQDLVSGGTFEKTDRHRG
jgi:aryl-alcohol dehydrogenase-like predicted oxidoreductase